MGFFMLWYLLGLVGSCILAAFEHYVDNKDFTLREVQLVLGCSILGPFMLCGGIIIVMTDPATEEFLKSIVIKKARDE